MTMTLPACINSEPQFLQKEAPVFSVSQVPQTHEVGSCGADSVSATACVADFGLSARVSVAKEKRKEPRVTIQTTAPKSLSKVRASEVFAERGTHANTSRAKEMIKKPMIRRA